MIKNLYLPRISEEANLAYPDLPGIWHETSGKVLSQLADAISITKSELKTIVSSIPDVWARPILFWTALYEVNHPLHEKLYQEWKGLLSLIALSKIKRYHVRFSYVNLGNDEFSRALKKLKPQSITLQKDIPYDWETIIMIYYDDIPIGAFSPATLVYTASQYNKKLMNKPIILKDESGFLKPPDSKEELRYVGSWAQNLYIKLADVLFKTTENKDIFYVTRILQLLEDWIKDIKISLGISETQPIELPNDVEIPQEIENVYPDLETELLNKLKTYTIYSLILTPLVDREVSEAPSDILLKFDKKGIQIIEENEKTKQIDRVLVIHEQTLKNKNTRIWGKIKVADLGDDLSNIIELFNAPDGYGNAIYNIIHLENAIWIKPETYFLTDTLLKSPAGKFLNDTEHEINHPLYVYPLKKEIFQFFTAEEIVKLLSPKFEVKNPDTIIFSIEIPLQNGEKIQVSKTYKNKPSQGEGQIISYNPPVLEIFPDYMPKWKNYYYLFQNYIDLLDFEPVGIKIINSMIHENENLKIIQMETFPEALEVKKTEDGKPLGLILLKTSKEKEITSNFKRFVGIDLGTSNTNIYIWNEQSASASKFYLNFENYIRRVAFSDDNIRENILKEFFVPPKLVSFPVPTLLRIIDDLKEKEFFLNAFIYFQDSYKTPKNVRSGFKWEAEKATELELYIKSLLFLILVDSIKNNYEEIILGITYPKAFSEDMKLQYRIFWQKYCNEFASTSGVRTIEFSEERAEKVNMYTEGYASGQFFANEEIMREKRIPRAYIQQSALCMDVGGGTTDIAIWYHDQICLNASIRLAGNNLMDVFRRNKKLREILFSPQANKELENVLDQPNAFASKLNVILKLEENEIKNKLLTYARSKEISELRYFIALQFSAIAFYTGMLVAYAEKNLKNAKGILETFKNKTSIHWGGNGAKFINWITFGEFDRTGTAVKLLNAIFLNSIKLEFPDFQISENIEQFQSPAPKDEASGGTSVILKEVKEESKIHEETDLGSKDLIIGEDIILKTGEEIKALEIIDPAVLFDKDTRKTKFKETTLNKLTKFIELYNSFGAKFGLLQKTNEIKIDSNLSSLLKVEISSHFVDLEKITDENKRNIEPVFILEVKSLMINLIYHLI